MDYSTITLETDRLRLVPISDMYAEEIFKEFNKDLVRYMTPPLPKNINDTKEFISSSLDKMSKGEDVVLIVLDKNNNEFLGCVGVHKISSGTPELGIWIKVSAHGSGYGREAVTVLKNWAEHNLDYQYLRYPAAKQNLSSRKIPESLGGKIEAESGETSSLGEPLDIVEYRIYRS